MSASDSTVSLCGKLGLKPLNLNNLKYYYAPIQGVASYTALSVNVMNPKLVLRLFPRRDITNVLLMNTLVGSSLYLYNREHMKKLSMQNRILYSLFGSVTFSLGSILLWAILRSLVPQNVALCTACGVGSGVALLHLGRNYVQHLDNIASKDA